MRHENLCRTRTLFRAHGSWQLTSAGNSVSQKRHMTQDCRIGLAARRSEKLPAPEYRQARAVATLVAARVGKCRIPTLAQACLEKRRTAFVEQSSWKWQLNSEWGVVGGVQGKAR